MRDILTALAGVVILLLVAALAVPPFVTWEGHRAFIDRTIGQSLGIEARSEGRIGLRLLPSPRLTLGRLRLGPDEGGALPDRPTLDLHSVKAELALSPLLTRELRFTDTRIGRAEVKVPVAGGDALILPAGLMPAAGRRDLAIENLTIRQVVLTTVVARTGRTEQLYAEAVHIDAPRLSGPWRVEGASRGVPFRLATGEQAQDGGLALKISGGGDTHPRFEAEARVALLPLPGGIRGLVPEAEGSARMVVGPPVQAAGGYLPFSVTTKFSLRGFLARLREVAVEIDPGGQAVRLAGTGQVDLRSGRTGLALEARRLDFDAFLLSPAGQAFVARRTSGRAAAGDSSGPPMMVDLDLKAENLVLGFDEWSNLTLGATFDRTGGLVLRRLAVTGPGAARLDASGEIDTADALRFTGRLSLDTPASDGLGRYLRTLGVDGPAVAVMDGRPIQLSTDLSAAAPTLSLRNLRLILGEAQITGNARYTRGEAGGRGRFDAQLLAQALDIATLPSFGGTLGGLEGHDLGLTLQARDVRYGPAGSGKGTITARIQSDGPSLVVDSLDITDLAGANARLSGRIAPDGTGRVTGRVSAPVAAPLFALLDRIWLAEARLVPAFLRAGALDLAVTLERDAGATDTLRVAAEGQAAGGDLDLDLLGRGGRVAGLDLTLATTEAGAWFGRTDLAGLRRHARLHLTGADVPLAPGASSTGLGLRATVTLGDLAVTTVEPLVLDPDQGAPRSGEIRFEGPDLSPVLSALTGAAIPSSLPAALNVRLARAGPDARIAIGGDVSGQPVSATLTRAPDGTITGRATLARLSLPALAAALVIPVQPRSPPSADGAAARFGAPPPVRATVDLALRVDGLDLGRGHEATGATLSVRFDDGALSLRDLAATLAGGRLTAAVTLARQGGAASVAGEGRLTEASLPGLVGGGAVAGRITAALRFGASGESATGLLNTLGGSGEITLADVSLPGADPTGLDRALARALAEDDPLRDGRLSILMNEELTAGPFVARGPVTSPVSVVGGALRAGPLDLALGSGRWTGTLGLDLRTGRLDMRGALMGASAPKGWSGASPAIQLGFGGTLARPERTFDAGPLTNGLAALVLQRELEKIELFEADQAERQRRRARIEMDKARALALKAAAEREAAEKAAAEKAAAEEATRQARLRAQQAAAEEAARQAQIREAQLREARMRAAEEAARRAAEMAPDAGPAPGTNPAPSSQP